MRSKMFKIRNAAIEECNMRSASNQNHQSDVHLMPNNHHPFEKMPQEGTDRKWEDRPSRTEQKMDELMDLLKAYITSTQQQQQQPQSKKSLKNQPRISCNTPKPVTPSNAAKYELEARDRQVFVELPEVGEGRLGEAELKRWVSGMVVEVYSAAFNSYTKNEMRFEQSKIYCSENIFKNLVRLNQHYQFTAEEFKLIDEHIKEGVMTYLQRKYPSTDNPQVNKKFESAVHEMDNLESYNNNLLNHTSVVFEYRQDGNYNSMIMRLINEVIEYIEKEDQVYGRPPAYMEFQNFISNLFDNCQDQKWMTTAEKETVQRTVKILPPHKEEQADKDRQQRMHEQAEKYRAKVKEYTHYLIGRKIPENTPSYTEKQIQTGKMAIKNPKVLRILTKWCEELWQKFEQPNYFSSRNEIMKVQRGTNVNTLLAWMKRVLDKHLAKEKTKIQKFIANLSANNYVMQTSLLAREISGTGNEEFDQLQKVCGKFSTRVVQNLHSYTIAYLNRLIHGLCKVARDFYKEGKLSIFNYWPSPPNLITFRLGDLLRCKFSSRQKQVLRVYRQLQEISRNHPQKLKIVRIKNRLRRGTNDILINIRFNDRMLCQLQLGVKSKSIKTHSILCSNKYNHYTYEVQRSKFGPLTQLASIWISLDTRAQLYAYMTTADEGNHQIREHPCKKLRKRVEMQKYQNPFICSQCNKTYFHTNYLRNHVKCKNCKEIICGRCRIEVETEENLKNTLILNQNIKQLCGRKVAKDKKLPPFGLCIYIEAKTPKFEMFTLINYNHKEYLLGENLNREIYEIEDISTPAKIKKFRERYIIFQFTAKGDFRKIKTRDAIKGYILPSTLKYYYQKEKESISLMDMGLTDDLCSEILTVGTKMQKENVKNLFLSDNKLTKLPFGPEDFSNIQWLTLSRNPIESITGIESLKELRKIMMNTCRMPSFPAELTKLQKLQDLMISGNPFMAIPDSISQLSNLKELLAADCQLSSISEMLSFCIKLKTLKIEKNKLTSLPDAIFRLKSLETLFLQDNQLTSLPQGIGELKSLKMLKVNRNPQLVDLPKSFGDLISLETFDGSLTSISELPPDLSRLQELYILKLNGTKIRKLSPSIGGLKYLEQLYLLNNPGLELPEEIKDLQQLKEIYASNCHMISLPQGLSSLKKLEVIDFSKNQLTAFPQGTFQKMTKLKQLNISHNALTVFPDLRFCTEVWKLSCQSNRMTEINDEVMLTMFNIQEVNLSQNLIEEFPPSLVDKNKLRKLNLSHNRLMSTVSEVKEEEIKNFGGRVWPILVELNLSHNSLKQLPTFLCRCVKLTTLSLSCNRLSMLPKQFGELTSLSGLEIASNSFEFYPSELLPMGGLKTIDLSANPIKTVPEAARNSKNLKSLLLRKCPLQNAEGLQVSKWIHTKEENDLKVKEAPQVKRSKQIIPEGEEGNVEDENQDKLVESETEQIEATEFD